jgi:hypothetical protein
MILDDNGNVIKSGYIAKSAIYGTHIFSTLEAAKLYVTRETFPKVKYFFYDPKDERYYSFTAYEEINVNAN